MTFSIVPWLNLSKLPPLGVQAAYTRMLGALTGETFVELRGELTQAVEACRAWGELEIRWKARRRDVVHARGARELDATVDRTLVAVDQTLAAAQKSFGDASTCGRAAALLRAGLFPQGVGAVIQLPYVEQLEKISNLLQRARQEPELAEAVRITKLEAYLERVAELNARYREVLSQREETVTYPELRATRDANRETYSWIVARVLVHRATPGLSPEEATALDRALHGVSEQHTIAKRKRRRRPPKGDAA